MGPHKHLVGVNSAALQFAFTRDADCVEAFVSHPKHFRVSLGDWVSAVYLASEDSHVLASGGDYDASGNRAGHGAVPFCVSHDRTKRHSLWHRV